MTVADSGQYFIFLVNYYQTPAQPPFRGHFPWSRRRCPLNIASTVFRSPYQGKMLLIATAKQNTLSSESPFPEIHFALSAASFLRFNSVVFSLSIFLIYKGVNNTENACNEAK